MTVGDDRQGSPGASPPAKRGPRTNVMEDRKAEICRFVSAHLSEQGFPPTIREIRDHLGLKSVTYTHKLVGQLIDEGRLERGRGARTLRLGEESSPSA